eukprot:TRINITY_DN2953_c0_g1_i13.p1 TRINITY_DN2953_c0_g1~~TRINITY_DN2953_c0_g1_i13.p1  ORF type:complete len:338 (+),score=55.20 TRINITY_DN2953_c0_g1_i13:846-1859(+)
MEYASGGELKDYLKSKGKLTELEAHDIFVQILQAVNHCHALNIIHRDLKLENVLFLNAEHKKIKIVDFGIAGLIQDNKADKSKAGSLRYMAPEILTGKNIEARPALDVWSMGCMLFALVCGELPFNGNTVAEIIERIKLGSYTFPKNSSISADCKSLIHKMLLTDYKKRITIKEILRGPWVLDINAAPVITSPKLAVKIALNSTVKLPLKEASRCSAKEEQKANSKFNLQLPFIYHKPKSPTSLQLKPIQKNLAKNLRNAAKKKGKPIALNKGSAISSDSVQPKAGRLKAVSSFSRNAEGQRRVTIYRSRLSKGQGLIKAKSPSNKLSTHYRVAFDK